MERIECEPITIYAKTTHTANRDRRSEGLVAKVLAGSDITDMHLYARAVYREECITECNACMSIARRVEDDPRALFARLVNSLNEYPLMITLERIELPAKALRFCCEGLFKLSQTRNPIAFRLTSPKEV